MVPNGTFKGTTGRGCGTSVESGRVEKLLPEMFETIREGVITNRKTIRRLRQKVFQTVCWRHPAQASQQRRVSAPHQV